MRIIFSLLALALVLSACGPAVMVNSTPKSAPPGQVKKVTGSQSAKPYAPGQQKKKF